MNTIRCLSREHSLQRFTMLAAACLVMCAVLFSSVLSFAHAQVAPPDLGSVTVSSSLRPELHTDAGSNDTYLVVLENSGAQDVQVAISQADFSLSETGDVQSHPGGTLAVSNASWLQSASQVVVPAEGSATVPVALEVPADASPGTYFSLLFLEPNDATSTEEAEAQEGVTTSVTVKIRIGVTMITHVGESSDGELIFRDPALQDDADQGLSLTVTIDNPDAFLASADVWLELYDDSGAVVHRVDAEQTRIYPGSARQVTFVLGQVQPARYQAVVIADAGDDRVYGVRYDLELGSD